DRTDDHPDQKGFERHPPGRKQATCHPRGGRRMVSAMSRAFVLGLALAACSSPPAQLGPTLPPPNAPPPAEPVAAAPPPEPKSKPAVTSDPDTPTGADAARDAELAKKVRPIIEAFVDNGAALTPDGKRLIFRSDRDGLAQLYAADPAQPAAPATRIVTSTERVGDFAVARDGKYVLYMQDKGGDENWSLWRVDLDGKNPTELT